MQCCSIDEGNRVVRRQCIVRNSCGIPCKRAVNSWKVESTRRIHTDPVIHVAPLARRGHHGRPVRRDEDSGRPSPLCRSGGWHGVPAVCSPRSTHELDRSLTSSSSSSGSSMALAAESALGSSSLMAASWVVVTGWRRRGKGRGVGGAAVGSGPLELNVCPWPRGAVALVDVAGCYGVPLQLRSTRPTLKRPATWKTIHPKKRVTPKVVDASTHFIRPAGSSSNDPPQRPA